MNGRTAQESRVPVNGTAAANGTNGHGPQPEARLGQVPADNPTGRAGRAGWQADQQIAEIPVEQAARVRTRARSRPRTTGSRRAATGPRRSATARGCRTVRRSASSTRPSGSTRSPSPRWRCPRTCRPRPGACPNPSSCGGSAATSTRPRAPSATIASELEVTAGKLVRLAANEGQACGVGWGVCPEHGLTLMNVGETVTCHVLGCEPTNEGAVERCRAPGRVPRGRRGRPGAPHLRRPRDRLPPLPGQPGHHRRRGQHGAVLGDPAGRQWSFAFGESAMKFGVSRSS